MRELKFIIDEISNNYLHTNEQTLSALSGSLKLVKKMFPRYSSFIMEFIQNADDVGSSIISISLDEEKVVIKNDGRTFNEKDIRSLCSIGESTKSIEDYIGYLGIGFKSIYLISNSVEIRSNRYSFAFKKDRWDNTEKLPWQILPFWIEDSETLMKANDTIFKIANSGRPKYYCNKCKHAHYFSSKKGKEHLEFGQYPNFPFLPGNIIINLPRNSIEKEKTEKTDHMHP